jgi:hypothetical protein
VSRQGRVLWKLESPFVDGDHAPVEFLITSAVLVKGESPETYVFAASKDRKVLRYRELPGSFKGDLDHDRAFKGFSKATKIKGARA